MQFVPTVRYGDAIGNDALAINDLLIDMGYQTAIYADGIDLKEEQKEKYTVLPVEDMPELNEDDVLIFHLSTSTTLRYKLNRIKCRKIAIYHNVTPPEFFEEYRFYSYYVCKRALTEVKQLKNAFDYCLADSDFNRRDLVSYGYKCKIDVRPILIPYKDYEQTPNNEIIDKYNDGRTNILFLGRVSPSKKQENIIATFSCYKKNYNPDARLLLVGSDLHTEEYQERLEEYVKRLGVEDVIFTGKVLFDEMLAYYKIADVFLCKSEHEGFCVPLVESMYFDVPIIAYASTAVPETLGGSGILLSEKDPLLTAGVINKVVSDENLKNEILETQRKRLSEFSYENVSRQFKKYLLDFIEGKK